MIDSDYKTITEVNYAHEVSKSQNIRLLDITFIGPMMIYVAYKYKMNPAHKAIMILLGLSTIYYNYKNYQATKDDGLLVGRKSNKKNISDFSADQIQKGILVEMEHTNNPRIALEITLDHLAENDHYYDLLESVHSENEQTSNIA